MLGSSLGDIYRHWLSCVGVVALEGAPALEAHITQCIAAQDYLGPLVDEEPLGDASDPLEAVEAQWKQVLSRLSQSDVTRCEGLLEAHEAHRLAPDLRAACVKAKELVVAKKKRAKRQRKLVTLYKQMRRELSKGKTRRADKALVKLEKLNEGALIDSEFVDSWRREITRAEEEKLIAKERAKQEKRRQKAIRKARAKADKLMRSVPRYEAQCTAAKKTYAHAVEMIRSSAAKGKPGLVQKYDKVKDKTYKKACKARANVMKVYEMYRSQGIFEAAEAVKGAAQSCLRDWRCR